MNDLILWRTFYGHFRQNTIILGCADGSVEVANSELSHVVAVFKGSHSKAGVIHLQVR